MVYSPKQAADRWEMDYNIYSGSKPVESSASYDGYNLETAKTAYVNDELDLESFENLIECILIEAQKPINMPAPLRRSPMKREELIFDVDQMRSPIVLPAPDLSAPAFASITFPLVPYPYLIGSASNAPNWVWDNTHQEWLETGGSGGNGYVQGKTTPPDKQLDPAPDQEEHP